ncbi:undecaprenyl-phosphate glucose phosphotransferase [Vibrio lentus]|uniref:Undecaprenyl-phosphate glucose phosphotransferase n=3 Tax=Vibrio lentus TaxID=136468 RepID=A0AA44VRJ4_9VIBR|nr:undecaprenyl-phosphate glucose phosphotransferase [Vibrio lentus]MCB5358417.1 undecaprenyl-phosphate glucose phosphotransferase [Vibrio lentus]MCB5448885.1 undecaprenyl-phosphate glucose phosphotransferase [Vibrio lentus]MCB5460772.1 undecaprenyl-phosphate glucose phosphotransferase [Vibrio lentus]MCC4796030.1 undecaprenyl-phosphate glucose phosphotransferase [Vibrio lentus]MCC4853400.1 undecaprenyl-phosphate glucose phosphotransferase [Vibrio lentus]
MISKENQIQNGEYESIVAHKMLDLLIIVTTLLTASWLYLGNIPKNYFILAGLGCVIYLLFAQSFELYRNQDFTTTYQKAQRLTMCWAMTVLVILMLAFFAKRSEVHSRVVIAIWLMAVPYFMVSARALTRLSKQKRFAQNQYQNKAIVIGATEAGYHMAGALEKRDSILTFEGIYDDTDTSTNQQAASATDGVVAYPIKGDIKQALVLAKERNFKHVFIALQPLGTEKVKALVEEFSDSTARIYVVPNLQTFDLMQSRWRTINGVPTVSVHDTPFNGVRTLIKRIEDIVASTLILALISPVLAVVSIGVKLSSPGPIIFKQKRYGLDGKEILIWKFRSMSTQDNGAVVKQATKNDPRVTKFGAFIRKTSLDELPQFINVLQGRMSIVGPRPHAVAHNEEYRQVVGKYMLRHKVKPGITGLAQVSGYRGETDTIDKMEKRVEYDLKYIRTWSLWLDIKIIVMTVFKGFVGKTAY